MEGEHGEMGQEQAEINDAYQPYHAHNAYLDPTQSQAMAGYMPTINGLDAGAQAVAMQHYTQQITGHPTAEQPQQGQQSETESDIEEGMDAGMKSIGLENAIFFIDSLEIFMTATSYCTRLQRNNG